MNKIFTKNKDVDVRRLRCTLGWLAIALPWIVAILLQKIPSSISATYYTYQSGPVFMIILGSCSFLLISYKGYEKKDDIINTIAGIFGLLICLFPCYNQMLEKVGTFQLPVNLSSTIHNISAAVFFALLAYNSAFLFTKGNKYKTKNKIKRNKIYVACSIGMIASFSLFLFPDFYIKVWLIETIALFFFGISFLTKANCYKFLFAENNEPEFLTSFKENYAKNAFVATRMLAIEMEKRIKDFQETVNILLNKKDGTEEDDNSK